MLEWVAIGFSFAPGVALFSLTAMVVTLILAVLFAK